MTSSRPRKERSKEKRREGEGEGKGGGRLVKLEPRLWSARNGNEPST